ncbi:YrvL family regulatory protein [Bacillus bingmayongensis]|uniref:YrvL family regulatory protein n=1 Tax=Bacillus bingmayongensis TaxID=1150157 RepID=UPI0003090851|nr:YrvL family regulatory protein [Bacillus bingmayongensis]MBY0595582.1 regulatory YrvL family protein [Bacillus bingmayongensis]
MNSDEEKFSDLSGKDKTIVISSITLLIIFAIALIFFMYVGVFRLIGVEYTSRTALLLFFLLALILDGISSFLILFFKVLLTPLLKHMPKWMAFSLLSLIEISLDWLVIHTADDWMESVMISNRAELLIVLVFFTLDKVWPTDNKRKSKITSISQ